jgi:membrane-associated phospholipid phosphatase
VIAGEEPACIAGRLTSYSAKAVDWRVSHFLNGLLRGHDALQNLVSRFGSWSVPIFAAATLALWLAARPGGLPRWKLACVSALTSAGLGLIANQAIGHLWFRDRPYTAHPGQTLLLSAPSQDPSFPSDHATAAFAIALAVLFFSRRVGLAFLAGAAAIGSLRVLVGLHYAGDVLAGVLIGLGAAVFVRLFARTAVERLATLAGRLSDPVLRPVWRFVPRRRPQLALAVVLAASLYGFGQLGEDTEERGSIVRTDDRLAVWIHGHVSDAIVDPGRVITLAGGAVALAILTFIGTAALARTRRYEGAALLLAAFVGAELLNTGLKAAFHRARPHFEHPLAPVPHSYSFPSGHASVSAAVYGALALLAVQAVRSPWARAAIGASAIGLVAAIGASRVVLDVHYLSDVLAGFSIGVAWLSACVLALLTFRGPRRLVLLRVFRSNARAAP